MSDSSIPTEMQQIISDWDDLRASMIRYRPDSFSRDEWGYLLSFLDPASLQAPWRDHFMGKETRLSPKKNIAIWTPNNVSLLGPLIFVLLSLLRTNIRVKSPSSAHDLAGDFWRYLLSRARPGPLADWAKTCVEIAQFDRMDSRNLLWAAEADMRIVIGSDEACAAVNALPHPESSRQISFGDHRSVAWIEDGEIPDDVLDTLIRVFAIYGQAGCTSPSMVVLLNGSRTSAQALRDRILRRWPEIIRRETPWHTASAHTLADQWARANGWTSILLPRHEALLAVGEPALPAFNGPLALPITWASPDKAIEILPANLQTIGYVLQNPQSSQWISLQEQAKPLRWVPLAEMHFFRHVWDGQAWWADCWDTQITAFK